jgi:galactokinase
MADPRHSATIDTLHSAFAAAYGRQATGTVRAPGRVNLIGEHTDYNDGFCLPMAIDRAVHIAWAPRTDGRIRVLSQEKPGAVVEMSAGPEQHRDPTQPWADYLKGCVRELALHGVALRGGDLALTGDVPLGSGLSSSAALEVATMHALLALADCSLDGVTIAKLAQKAENRFVGVNCGILDQLSSACCRADAAMLMDCRTMALTYAPLPAGVSVVIADTGKRRGLVDSAYNERRSQCEAGAQALGVSHLRDVSLHGLLSAHLAGSLSADARRRCEHVVAENGRTVAAAACLRAGDVVALGQLMDQSHLDLRDKFEVTCVELDDMVGIARGLPGCLGSRMTGAGFGGCTVSLVESDRAPAFVESLMAAYRRRHDLPAAAFVTGAAAGAGAV